MLENIKQNTRTHTEHVYKVYATIHNISAHTTIHHIHLHLLLRTVEMLDQTLRLIKEHVLWRCLFIGNWF